jgi:hypothetical protein
MRNPPWTLMGEGLRGVGMGINKETLIPIQFDPINSFPN